MKAVDLFAGWGGFTEGATRAGVDVIWAANHWQLAVDAHRANHPDTIHACQDLKQADWSLLPDYDLLLASPACQGHSSAARPARAANGGTRRTHDALRATAWAVVDCADITNPAALVVENVLDFREWRLYPAWRIALQMLGYHLEEHVIRASHFGAPQRRDRLFVVGTLRNRPVELEPSAEIPFGPCIEWDAPARWKPVAGASVRVQERIAAGRARHGRRFLTQHVTAHKGVSLDEPIRTITTKDQWAIVRGDSYRPLTIRENARAMGFPDTYRWPRAATRRDQIRGLGNAVCPPVAQALIERVAAVA